MEHTKTFVSDVNYLPKQSYTVCAKFPKERLGTEREPRALFRHKMVFFSKPQFSERAPWALFRKITVVLAISVIIVAHNLILKLNVER